MTDEPLPGFWAKVDRDYDQVKARIEHLPPAERHAVMDALNAHRARAVNIRDSAIEFANKLDALVDQQLVEPAEPGGLDGDRQPDTDWLLATALGAQLARDFAAGIAPEHSIAKQLADQRNQPSTEPDSS